MSISFYKIIVLLFFVNLGLTSYSQLDLPIYPQCHNFEDVMVLDSLIHNSKNHLNNDASKSFCYLLKAKKTSKTIKEKEKVAKNASKLSDKLYKNAKYKEAIHFQSLTATIWYELDSINNYAVSLRKIGFDFYRLGDIYNTIKYIDIALELSKNNNQKLNEYFCLYQLAWANWRIKNCDEAIRYIQLSKQIIDDGPAKKQISSYYNSLSSFYRCQGDIQKAIETVDKAIKINKEKGYLNSYGVNVTNKAHYLIDYNGNPKEIIAMIYEVLKINKKSNDLEQLGSNYGLLANAYIYNKDYTKAIQYALKGKKISGEIGDLPRVLISYEFLKIAYQKKGNYINALKYSEKYNTLNEKLYGNKNSIKIFDLQQKNAIALSSNEIAKLKNEKKLSDLKSKQSTKTNWYIGIIFLLFLATLLSYFLNARNKQKRNSEIKNEQLSHQLLQTEMEALRARMNPHFLFNSLNSIKSFITKNDPREASNYLSKFAVLVRMILNHSKEKTIPLSDELEAIKYYVEIEKMRLKDMFDCQMTITKPVDTNTIEVPPSIIQPFVENAIWHGFNGLDKKGILKITIFNKNKNTIIEIEDNGIGRENAARIKLKKEPHQSTGLKIIDKTIEVYKAKKIVDLNIEIKDLFSLDKTAIGTKVIITIKNQQHG